MRRLLLVAGFAVSFWQPVQAKDVLTVGEAPFISGGPYYIAREKGYFDKVGIEVHTKIFNDGALAVPALISGELDVSAVTMSAGLFNSIAKGAPMIMFLDRGNNDMDRGGSAINVSNEMFAAGLKGPADMALLKGKARRHHGRRQHQPVRDRAGIDQGRAGRTQGRDLGHGHRPARPGEDARA